MSSFVHSGDEFPDEKVSYFSMKQAQSVIEYEDRNRRGKAKEIVKTQLLELPQLDNYYPQALRGAIFVGHLVTDLDSIAGAIGAAELYGGVAARASEINSETAFALHHWKVATPPPIEGILESDSDAKICLVDHQQTSQLNPAINVSNACI